MKALLLAALLALSAGAADAAEAPAASPHARIAQGEVRGAALAGGVSAFLGLPYAAPPVGDRRWRAPAPPSPPSPWRGVRKATTFGASCMQSTSSQGFGPWTHEYVTIDGPVSEDCLYLNVWTPAHSKGSRLPVMVWIHGGGFVSGSGAMPLYSGERMARDEGVIVVTINYRLGVFGFFSHPELSKEGVNGNQAGYDAVAALRWVHDNIAAFGGDPTRVTIAGQSGGAAMVNALLLSPRARGLFAGAIAQSFPMGALPSAADLAEAQARGDRFAQSLKASSLADLRAAPASEVLAKGQGYGWPACTCLFADGDFLPAEPSRVFAEGRQNDVPVMAGFVSEESPFPVTLGSYASAMARRYGDQAQDYLKLYPANSDAEALEQAFASGRERNLVDLQRWVDLRAATSRKPAFLYLYEHAEPGPAAARYKAFHTAEVPYVFGTLDISPERGFAKADYEISARMMRYWANFVRTGNPNGPGLPRWNAAASATPPFIMERGDRWGELAPIPAVHRAFFDTYYDRGGRPFLF